MNIKERAGALWDLHIGLASTQPTAFRKTVIQQLMAESGCSLAAASTQYNNVKNARTPVAGLGRPKSAPGVRKMGAGKPKATDPDVADDDCFSVIEIVGTGDGQTVGRCQAFILQGDASEKFDSKIETWPNCTWVMVKGLGPIHGDPYKLEAGEMEIKRHAPALVS